MPGFQDGRIRQGEGAVEAGQSCALRIAATAAGLVSSHTAGHGAETAAEDLLGREQAYRARLLDPILANLYRTQARGSKPSESLPYHRNFTELVVYRNLYDCKVIICMELCPECNTELVEEIVEYNELTEGQQADYAGFRDKYCPKCGYEIEQDLTPIY